MNGPFGILNLAIGLSGRILFHFLDLRSGGEKRKPANGDPAHPDQAPFPLQHPERHPAALPERHGGELTVVYDPEAAGFLMPTLTRGKRSVPRRTGQGKLQVRCFGWFDVFWHDEPLIFARTRTKELFANLIDREGAACSAREIVDILWEDLDAVKDPKAYLRPSGDPGFRGQGCADPLPWPVGGADG